MRYYLYAGLIFIGFVSMTACNKDKEGSLTLHFVPTHDGLPLQTLQDVDLIDEIPLQFRLMTMLVSDIELLDQPSNKLLRDVELVDMSFENTVDASNGYTVVFDDIPAKEYNGLSFGIGVPSDLNAMTPSEFPSSHPLSLTGYYWQAWESYIFMKIEGRLDTIAPVDYETSFAFHTGSNELYRVLATNTPLLIEDGKNLDLYIAFNYPKLLEGINIVDNPQNHNPQDTVQINRIVNNLQNAVSLHQ